MNSLTVTADRVYYHADDGTTYGHCKITMVSAYKPQSYRDAFLTRLDCGVAEVNGLYWFYLVNGRLIHIRSSRGS
jgi:hypothetical protein